MSEDYTDRSEELMQVLMAKLYATITGDVENADIMPRNKFVTWLMPGIPFGPNDFRCCSKGLGGGLNATEDKLILQQAFYLSKLFDFIPDINNPLTDTGKLEQTIFTSSQDSISSVYSDILTFSEVVDDKLSPEDEAKIKKFRDLMSVTKMKKDIITDEIQEVTEPGPITIAYETKMKEFLDAEDAYLTLLVNAQGATDSDPEGKRAVAAWANKADNYYRSVRAAYNAWISQGYKNEYEKMNAFIDQITQRSMVLYKRDLIEKFRKGKVNNAGAGGAGEFYNTLLLPGNFATSAGWTGFTFGASDYKNHYSKSKSQWGVKASAKFGFGSAKGSASGSKERIQHEIKMKNFSASLKFTQVPICRPFMDPGIFSMRGWRLSKEYFEKYGKDAKSISDGSNNGRLVAYPISALFVKDVKLYSGDLSSQFDFVKKEISGGGSVSYGPFSVGGSYSHGSEESNLDVHVESGSLNIPGMQLIGFMNNYVPKCPNTNPDIPNDRFV